MARRVLTVTIDSQKMNGYWLKMITTNTSKLNFKIYQFIFHLDQRESYSTNTDTTTIWSLWTNQNPSKYGVLLMLNLRCLAYVLFKHVRIYQSQEFMNLTKIVDIKCNLCNNNETVDKTSQMYINLMNILCTKNIKELRKLAQFVTIFCKYVFYVSI